jgi:hypothetical protein
LQNIGKEILVAVAPILAKSQHVPGLAAVAKEAPAKSPEPEPVRTEPIERAATKPANSEAIRPGIPI